jgi:hypothetical protein
MTTAFHPQADGRSERTNRTVGQVLRTFTAKRQGKWLESLAAVEYAINGAVNVAIGQAPYELIFGRKQRLLSVRDAEDSDPAILTKWFDARHDAWLTARDALWTSRVQQAIQHNKTCRVAEPLLPDSWALLDSADWRGRHQGGVNKLKERFEGPYRVIKSLNHGQNVELELPEGDKRHNVFHVSKVKPYIEREEGGVNTLVERVRK